MEENLIDEIASGWIAEYSSPNKDRLDSERIDDFWNQLTDLVYGKHENAWNIILRIIDKTDDKFVISNVAAGPLESLIAQHGSIYLKQIEAKARSSPKFCFALTVVWQNFTPDDLWQQIQGIVRKYSS
jgi:hypothetical protein